MMSVLGTSLTAVEWVLLASTLIVIAASVSVRMAGRGLAHALDAAERDIGAGLSPKVVVAADAERARRAAR